MRRPGLAHWKAQRQPSDLGVQVTVPASITSQLHDPTSTAFLLLEFASDPNYIAIDQLTDIQAQSGSEMKSMHIHGARNGEELNSAMEAKAKISAAKLITGIKEVFKVGLAGKPFLSISPKRDGRVRPGQSHFVVNVVNSEDPAYVQAKPKGTGCDGISPIIQRVNPVDGNNIFEFTGLYKGCYVEFSSSGMQIESKAVIDQGLQDPPSSAVDRESLRPTDEEDINVDTLFEPGEEENYEDLDEIAFEIKVDSTSKRITVAAKEGCNEGERIILALKHGRSIQESIYSSEIAMMSSDSAKGATQATFDVCTFVNADGDKKCVDAECFWVVSTTPQGQVAVQMPVSRQDSLDEWNELVENCAQE